MGGYLLKMDKRIFLLGIIALIFFMGCADKNGTSTTTGTGSTGVTSTTNGVKMPPLQPKGILVNEIPEEMDIIFDSVRYVISDPACLDDDKAVKTCFKRRYDGPIGFVRQQWDIFRKTVLQDMIEPQKPCSSVLEDIDANSE